MAVAVTEKTYRFRPAVVLGRGNGILMLSCLAFLEETTTTTMNMRIYLRIVLAFLALSVIGFLILIGRYLFRILGMSRSEGRGGLLGGRGFDGGYWIEMSVRDWD